MWCMVSGIIRIKDAVDALRIGASSIGLIVEDEDGFLSAGPAKSIVDAVSSPRSMSSPFQGTTGRESRGQHGSASATAVSVAQPGTSMHDFLETILVTHIIERDTIIHLVRTIGVTSVLLVGELLPETILELRQQLPALKIIKSLPVIDHASIRAVKDYIPVVDAIELDTMDMSRQRIGGTGRTHDWGISGKIVQEYGWHVPIILGGGLNAHNVRKAIQVVGPMGVDVSASVKDRHGMFDGESLAEFIHSINMLNRNGETDRSFSSSQRHAWG